MFQINKLYLIKSYRVFEKSTYFDKVGQFTYTLDFVRTSKNLEVSFPLLSASEYLSIL